MAVSQRGAPMVGADAANGFPVSSTTSSARTMRLPSVARIDEAAAGSTRTSSSCSAAAPISASRCSHLARTAGSVAGNSHSSSSDWMYIIEPPTMIGTRPGGRDALHIGGGVLLVPRDGRRLGDVQHVELVVWDSAAFCDGKLRGPDVHPAVELHGVGVHDLSAQPSRHRQGQCRLSGAGGADDRQRPHGYQTPAKYPTP